MSFFFNMGLILFLKRIGQFLSINKSHNNSIFSNFMTTSIYLLLFSFMTYVQGYFSLATEAQDDDGLPHTLEHMIFLGSEDYPYAGVLDILANKIYAAGTNAWTDTDNTTYTISTVEKDGFLQLLPIYLDHIFYPTLKESGYITEGSIFFC